ncbi:MAG: SpoIIE family protein phosphatase [Bacteroidales bacterium]|nr:MAG: SpoIIE family protein phosphatase [Bacteroidales bacterium]
MRILSFLVVLFPIISLAQGADNLKQRTDSLLSIAIKSTRNPDSTKRILAQVEKLAQEKGDSAVLSSIWSRYGFVNYWTGRYPVAIDYYSKAKHYHLVKNDSINAAWKGYMIGLTYKYWGKYHEAQKEIQENIKLFEKIGDEDGILNCYIVSGYINEAWGNFDEAERICRYTLQMAKEQSNPNAEAYSLLAIGNAFLSKSKIDSAYIYIDNSHKKFIESSDNYGIALVNRDLGTYYLLKGNTNKSLFHLKTGLEILKSSSNNRGYSEILAIIGKVYLERKDYENAVKNLEESQRLALEMELYEDIIKNFQSLSIAYEKWGKYDSALKCIQKYTHLKDSIFNAEKHFQIAELQTQYETEKKEQQIALQNIKLDKNKSIQRLLILAFVLASTLAFFSFRWYRIKKRDNQLLSEQKRLIEQKNTQITDSINYAKRIQGVLLGKSSTLPKPVKDLFILYQPKDIVSGDFYFIKEYQNYTVIAAADCTGHGVPGAFMSMLGVTLMNEVFTYSNPKRAAEVLEEMRIKVKEALNQTEYKTEAKDGMDMALCIIDKSKNQLQYSGAYNSLYLVRNNELTEYKAVRNPVGVHMKELPFQNEVVNFETNDQFYIFSDGYADQVGGSSYQKFKIVEFRKLIHSISSLPMNEQASKLESTIQIWKGSTDQTDDMLVVGFKM